MDFALVYQRSVRIMRERDRKKGSIDRPRLIKIDTLTMSKVVVTTDVMLAEIRKRIEKCVDRKKPTPAFHCERSSSLNEFNVRWLAHSRISTWQRNNFRISQLPSSSSALHRLPFRTPKLITIVIANQSM